MPNLGEELSKKIEDFVLQALPRSVIGSERLVRRVDPEFGNKSLYLIAYLIRSELPLIDP